MDDTLYSKFDGLQSQLLDALLNYVGRKTGIYHENEEATPEMKQRAYYLMKDYYKTYGLTLKGLRVNNKNGVDFDDYDAFIKSELDYSNAQQIEGLVEMLKELKDNPRNQLAIMTNSCWLHVESTLMQLGIYDLFDHIFVADCHDHNMVSKPNPIVYSQVQHALGHANPRDCYFIDDNFSFVEAAQLVGWNAVWLNESAPQQDQVTPVEPEILQKGTVGHILQMREAFNELFSE